MEKRFVFAIVIMLLFVSGMQLYAQKRQYLHEGWTFGEARFPNRYPAQVPGVVHTDLLRQGLIDDPYIGLNERKVQWVDKEDWVYETTFCVDNAILDDEHIDLCFDGLDTYADVFLNGSKILKTDNMFRRWHISVKTQIKAGDNTLRVYFHSPVKVDLPKWAKHPYLYQAANDQSENGGLLDRKLSVFARKAGYHYGWDWGPRLVTTGIWRSVYLDSWNKARITDIHLRQKEVTAKKALLTDVVEVETAEDIENALITVTDKNNGHTVATRKCSLHKGINTIPVEFSIKGPRLWWCNGLGKPELYTFTTKVTAGGRLLSQQDKRIGLRSVKLVTEPDAEGNCQFYFVLNGVPVFAKGTNYIPQDNFLTNVTPERYRQTLQDAVLANMNMIRVWGGGIYEDDLFYDLCDEMGLMVWQDFMFACSTYPWGWKAKMEKSNPEGARLVGEQQERLYYDVLQKIANQQIPDDIYTVGSPFSVRGRGSDGINGDRHFYGVGHRRMTVSSYNQEKAHFFSEYGMQSFPEYSTVLRYAPDTTTHDICSPLMMWHQRGGVEANKVIEWYVKNEYGEPGDFRQFLYASQLLQGDAMRTAIEAHRRNMPHCMGSLLWQHNDCWPVASWATHDYYGQWKAAHYMVRHAFEPLMCSAITNGDSLLVYTVSDLLRKQHGKLKLTVYTLSGQIVNTLIKTIAIPVNTSTLVLEQPLAELLKGRQREHVVVNMQFSASSGVSYQADCFLCLQKDLRLMPVKPEVSVEAAEGGCLITLKADKFVRALALAIDGAEDCWFSNNYFDLLPDEPTKCFVRTSLKPDEVKQRLTLHCLNNMTQSE